GMVIPDYFKCISLESPTFKDHLWCRSLQHQIVDIEIQSGVDNLEDIGGIDSRNRSSTTWENVESFTVLYGAIKPCIFGQELFLKNQPLCPVSVIVADVLVRAEGIQLGKNI